MLHRSTACGRGNAVLDQIDNPRRVLKPLKRVGARGSGQWETISFEQLVEEVVEGGDLFGEGKVAGLREIRDLETPIKADAPELGPRANGVVMLSSVNDGRDNMNLRWLKQAYGSTNYARHGSYCGGSYRSGSGAMFGDVKKMPHAKPDFEEAEFIIFIGTAPGNAGNPFKRIGAHWWLKPAAMANLIMLWSIRCLTMPRAARPGIGLAGCRLFRARMAPLPWA